MSFGRRLSRSPPIRRNRALPDPARLSIARAHGQRPSRAALSSAREPKVSTSDAPCRDTRCAEARHASPEPLSAPPRQEQRFRRPRAPSLDECQLSTARPGMNPGKTEPRTLTRHRSRSFAAPTRLPTLFRPPSRRMGARPCRFRTLFTPGRTWPRAARRLLQPKRSASTTSEPSKPCHETAPLGLRLAARFSGQVPRVTVRARKRPNGATAREPRMPGSEALSASGLRLSPGPPS